MEILSNLPLIWFIVGVVLLLLELVIPGLFVLFFGFGALVTAIITYLFEPSLTVQFLVFSLTSVLSLVLLRKVLMKRLYKKDVVDPDEEFIGHIGTCIEEIQSGGEGKIEFRGTSWTAISDELVSSGQKVKIINKEGLQLKVTPVN